MGFLDKLMFWKKSDDLGDLNLGSNPPGMSGDLGAPELGMGDMNQGMDNLGMQNMGNQQGMPDFSAQQGNDLGLSSQQSFQQTQQQPQTPSAYPPAQNPFQQTPQPQMQQPQQSYDHYTADKDMEIISSKLDALRAAIDSISQRLANIEALARGEQETQKRDKYYRY